MKYQIRNLLAAGLLLGGIQSAFAADLGTDAGTTVTNQATITFSVGGVQQSAQPQGTAQFVVDRKVDVIVTKVADASSVAPGQTGRMLTYLVTNKTNATLDFSLGAVVGGGTFTATNLQIFVDTNGNNTYDAGTDLQQSYIDGLAEDAGKTVFVFGDIPLSATDGQTSVVHLTATAADPTGTVASPGAALAESGAADNAAVVENVFADAAGVAAGDTAKNGKHSAAATYTVATTTVTVSKSYKVVFEDAAGSTNFSPAGQLKPIPGALVEYCILVTNSSSTVGATNIAINDPLGTLPNTVASNVNWVADSIRIKTGAGVDCSDYAGGSSEDDDATGADESDGAAGSFNSGTSTVSTLVDSLPANQSTATMFRVIIK